MADRRMISKKLILSDSFDTLAEKAKLLYLRLIIEADDDGFVGGLRHILSAAGVNKRSLEALCDKGFTILFSSGVVVVRHWKIHNRVPKDRYTPTMYIAEREQLTLDESGAYVLSIDSEEARSRFLNTKC